MPDHERFEPPTADVVTSAFDSVVWDTSVDVVDGARPFRCDSCAEAVNASLLEQWPA